MQGGEAWLLLPAWQSCLGSDRRAGIIPSPALSPLMEEQLATLNPLAGDLQGKEFSGDVRNTLATPAPSAPLLSPAP